MKKPVIFPEASGFSLQKAEKTFSNTSSALMGNGILSSTDRLLAQQIPLRKVIRPIGVAAEDDTSRDYAQSLLSNTKIRDLQDHPLFEDELYNLIAETTTIQPEVQQWTLGALKAYLLSEEEAVIKVIMPGLSSDIIACVVKLMSNAELITMGQKVCSPLPGTKIGSKGYPSARVQPNSPTA
ncbi:MAG: ethanolamine ammonia-lyase subunit EutB, partial [Phaeodactylibacter sp.]|nr:ethanolamine ammonia-lyase subunit EutB [Phaeodactylibacter sp.]